MTTDCFFKWNEIRDVPGPCIRPGGYVLTERALELCRLPPDSFVADIGCGLAGTLEYLEKTGFCRVAGLDYSETLLEDAVTQSVSKRLVRGQAEILPFKKSSLDALFCECVLSILSDRAAALQEFARILRKGGFLVISDLFHKGSHGQDQSEIESQGLQTKGLLAKQGLLGFLTELGFSLLLWEEHERLLKEFVARMIFAGKSSEDIWACMQGQEGKNIKHAGISYFLLVVKKTGDFC